jgi:hypothetical protein
MLPQVGEQMTNSFEPVGTYPAGGGSKPLVLSETEDTILQYFQNVRPEEAEPVHSFPDATEEILFDEPAPTGLYPTTEPIADSFTNLDLTLGEFKGDIISTPLSLDADKPLIGDISQVTVKADEGDIKVKTLSTTGETSTASVSKKKFNIWLLIIAAATIIGLIYLSKSKV